MPTPTARRKMIEDQKSAAARAYLEGALPLGIWAEASKKIGHNHAFIQQYIRRGKPKFLTKPDRDLLARTYDLDAEMLKPPRKSVRPIRRRPVSAAVVRSREKAAGDDSWINPRCDNLVENASKAEINHLLDQLSGRRRLAWPGKPPRAARTRARWPRSGSICPMRAPLIASFYRIDGLSGA